MNTKFFQYILFAFVVGAGIFIASCSKDEDTVSTDPVVLSYGPSPALRGGELRFIGKNMDKVTMITLPNNIEVKNFTSKTNEMVTIIVPQETVEGEVTVTTTIGTQKMKTRLTISEPITFVSLSPLTARPGEKITITGDYLNLIEEVIFPNKKAQAEFISQSREQIELLVPLDAQTGKVVISNGMPDPILIESDSTLSVVTAKATKLSPIPVKAGATLTIEGTDLDLVKAVIFGGNQKVGTFISQSVTKIEVQVPADAQDGSIALEMASLVTTQSTDVLEMVVPTISSVAPNPAKNGKSISIKGINLDLVTNVVFAADKAGTIASQSATEITVDVPLDAVNGVVNLRTKANKTVSSSELTFVKPTITGINPASTQSNKPIVISGTHLDLVVQVKLGGGKSVTVANTNETELTITVPSGTATDKITLVTTNGSEVVSANDLTIIASNVPEVTGYPTKAKPGELITLTGTKMNLVTDLIFPGNVVATGFGVKTIDKIEVVVPLNVQKGYGKIKFMTIDNEVSETELINFVGVDNVQDQDLVFFDFNGTGNKDAWWGNVKIVNDNNNVDGSSYGLVEGNYNGWTDLFWRNGSNNFPGATIGSNVNDYVVKFDINLINPIDGGNLKFRLNGDEGDYWWTWGPAGPGASVATTAGWETITVPISAFKDNNGWGANSPTSMAAITKEFGMAFADGAANVKFYIDNVRFERK
ncbi:MAG TPA: glycan-binding surface protein [Saprospiraceae bacterium]|nr:glycan-binding surface protein [Saprospiraceae bacterium]